jgi:hypothetical protein
MLHDAEDHEPGKGIVAHDCQVTVLNNRHDLYGVMAAGDLEPGKPKLVPFDVPKWGTMPIAIARSDLNSFDIRDLGCSIGRRGVEGCNVGCRVVPTLI